MTHQKVVRKASVTAKLSQTARKISTVVAPQLTRIEQVSILQKYDRLHIRIADPKKLESILERFTKHNDHINFEPVEFEVADDRTAKAILKARLFGDEIVVMEGAKMLMSIVILKKDCGWKDPILAKIRHPISGIKLLEIGDTGKPNTMQAFSCLDDIAMCDIKTCTSTLRKLLGCGLFLIPEWWTFEQRSRYQGQVYLKHFCWSESMVQLDWPSDTENDFRVLMTCFGIVQLIVKGCPTLLTMIQEHRIRKSSGGFSV